ncbi:esterase E4-like [Uranotaenia lowii]|uniref:esterase E4-like n=1 Tax=Uranotaenia lowii TaxID=190385 RepID=UPI00247B2676|nr:esterase E4-like [Uranotaenia lowii]
MTTAKLLHLVAAAFLVSVVFHSRESSAEPLCTVKLNDRSAGFGILNHTFNEVPFCAFLGVRYAEPPVGALRFKDAVLFQPSLDQNYTSLGSICPQEDNYREPKDVLGDEDCLVMNIYSPMSPNSIGSTNNKYPVIVFIHGGSFMTGSSSANVGYGVDLLIEQGLLIVSINYRLSALGFLYYPEFNVKGNFGLKDQTTALRWIQMHIHAFGGDPQRVTLMGQSAGSASVSYHLYMEASRGLFHGVILLSGSMLSPWAFLYGQSYFTDNLIKKLNISSLRDLQNVDVKSFFMHDFNVFESFSMYHPSFIPTFDTSTQTKNFLKALPRELILETPFNEVPVMVGQTSTEFELVLVYANDIQMGFNYPNSKNMSLHEMIRVLIYNKNESSRDPFFFRKLANMANIYYPIKQLTKALAKNLNKAPVFSYRFEFDGKFGFYKNQHFKDRDFEKRYGAVHGDDLGYIFSPYNVQEALANPENYEREWKMHMKMVGMVSNFVKYGEPTPPNIAEQYEVIWPPYIGSSTDAKYLNFDDTIEVRDDADQISELYQFWNMIYRCLFYYECEEVDASYQELFNKVA